MRIKKLQLSVIILSLLSDTIPAHANEVTPLHNLLIPLNYSQRLPSCDLEPQFNSDNLYQPFNLTLPQEVTCTWYDLRLPEKRIPEDSGMQITLWLQNDPNNPKGFAKANGLETINAKCQFEPVKAGKSRTDSWNLTDQGTDQITAVLIGKSGSVALHRDTAGKIINGNMKNTAVSDFNQDLIMGKQLRIDTDSSLNQTIYLNNIPNKFSFWDTADIGIHPHYAQVNIIFELNYFFHKVNNYSSTPKGFHTFNQGNKLTCTFYLPAHYKPVTT